MFELIHFLKTHLCTSFFVTYNKLQQVVVLKCKQRIRKYKINNKKCLKCLGIREDISNL